VGGQMAGPAVRSMSPHTLLYWDSIKWSRARELAYDLGGVPSDGVRVIKASLGAEAKPPLASSASGLARLTGRQPPSASGARSATTGCGCGGSLATDSSTSRKSKSTPVSVLLGGPGPPCTCAMC
jgi:hypothetical protein